MNLMATPKKKNEHKKPEPAPESAKKPNRTGKSLHCYINPSLHADVTALSEALDVDMTALTEIGLQLLLHTMGRGKRPEKLWLPQPPKDKRD
jgi:hypothetical protein